MARLLRTAILIALILTGRVAMAQHTYYISKSIGSDSNTSAQAQSKSTPWAHLPGMCYATCGPSYTPIAGDSFIMMGCDVWTNSDLPATWQWSGTSSSPINIGVDKTWYNTTNCPSGWNRPVWTAGKAVLSKGNNYFLDPSTDGTGPVEVTDHDVTFDNIEMTQLEITSSNSGGFITWVMPNSYNMTFSNMYLHGWDASADNCTLIQGPYGGGSSTNVVYEYNVIDGSDRTGTSGTTGVCYVFYTSYAGVKILNNVVRYVVNPFVGYTGSGSQGIEIGGNLIEYTITSIGGSHCNTIETEGGTFYIHDNVLRNMECGGGEILWMGNASGEVDYVWNNVIYNLDSPAGTAAGPAAGFNGGTGVQVYFWNNTVGIGVSQSGPCLSNNGNGMSGSTVKAQNNHCITGGANTIDPGFSGWGTFVNNNNLAMSQSTATSDGYTNSQTYAFSPTASNSPTVGQGTNLTSSWPSGFSTNDTEFGCSEQTVGGVVQAVCPARTTNTRGTTWDVGAYEFNAQDPPNAPNPPTGLTAVVN